MTDKGRSEEAHAKDKGEGLGPPPKAEPKSAEPELETVTSNDVGKQTKTKADK